MRGGPAADHRLTGRGRAIAGRHPHEHDTARGGALDGRRHAGGLRDQLRDGRGRTVGHQHAGHERQPGAHELRHLSVYAKRGGPGPGRRTRRAGGGRGGHRHVCIALAGGARAVAPASGTQ
ncbi:hypothetical protein G6F66_014637 [Rhizopus arrhizus]|nr:hypothetical protein G6F66_014637 [Rhizopus arrhizus]